MAPLPTLFAWKMTIDGYQIQVHMSSALPDQHKTFVLFLPPAVMATAHLAQHYLKTLHTLASEQGKNLPHFIYFTVQTPLATSLTLSQHIALYSRFASQVMQYIRQQSAIDRLQLIVHGEYFGSLVALNLPSHQPQWVTAERGIRLQHLFVRNVPGYFSGSKSNTRGVNLFQDFYLTLPKFSSILQALAALLVWKIPKKWDEVALSFLAVALIYTLDSKKWLNHLVIKLLRQHPIATVRCLLFWYRLKQKFNHKKPPAALGTSTRRLSPETAPAMETMAPTFNIYRQLQQHLLLYQQVPITFVVARCDPLSDWQLGQALAALLPKTSEFYLFNDNPWLASSMQVQCYEQLLLSYLAPPSEPTPTITQMLIDEAVAAQYVKAALANNLAPTYPATSTQQIYRQLGPPEQHGVVPQPEQADLSRQTPSPLTPVVAPVCPQTPAQLPTQAQEAQEPFLTLRR